MVTHVKIQTKILLPVKNQFSTPIYLIIDFNNP